MVGNSKVISSKDIRPSDPNISPKIYQSYKHMYIIYIFIYKWYIYTIHIYIYMYIYILFAMFVEKY